MNAPVFAASVTITEDHQRMISQAGTALVTVKEYEIDSQETAEVVGADMRHFQKQIVVLERDRKAIVKPLDEARDAVQRHFVPAIKNLECAVAHCKGLLVGWTQQQEAEREAEQRRLDEQARKEQQEREAQAAALRARAETEAAELKRQAEEAEKKRQAALAEGNAKAAAAAAAAAAKLTEQAEHKLDNAESKIAANEATAPVMMAANTPAKVSGFSTRKNWIARLKLGVSETDAVLQIAAALATRPELVVLLKLDMAQAKKMASTFEGSFNVPGLDAVNQPIGASRAA